MTGCKGLAGAYKMRTMNAKGPREPRADDDPTRALDGFADVLRATLPTNDPTRALDGWGGSRAAGSAVYAGATPAAPAAPRDVDADIVDVEVVAWHPAPSAAEPWQPSAMVPRAQPIAGQVRDWKPGAWIAAAMRVCGPLAEFVQGPDGPLVETHPPHLLLALWPPQGLDAPFLGRWPQRVWLAAAEDDAAAAALMAPALAPGAEFWLAPAALHAGVDWGLLADLVLHHDATLRDFQLRELKAFMQAQRDAAYARLNEDYAVPVAGGPVVRR
jgi:hypothetical protein